MKSSIILLGTVAGFALLQRPVKAVKSQSKPNIVFIFTDDQDYRMESLNYMPNVQKYLVKEGTVYENHYATIAVCCPSRVGLLRGQYAHNTNITDVSPPYGGYDRFNTLKLGEDYLPIWLQKAGYNTNYIGKLMNGYAVNNYNNPAPLGFDYQDQLVDPYTYIYNTAVFSTNGKPPVYYKDAYQTDIIHSKTRVILKRIQNQDDPFFLWVAPTAPHGQFIINSDHTIETQPPVPAARHANLFKDVKIPRKPHFNPTVQFKTTSYWKSLEKLNETLVEELDEYYRNRLRALQSVDEIVGTIFKELEQSGQLNNTYVFYSSDNGYHMGQHRSYPGKCTNLEEDINVPFIVRGPGIPKGKKSHIISSHHDIAPTFVALARGKYPSWVDGGVIPLTKELERHHNPASKESFAVEFWSLSQMAESYPTVSYEGPNTYKTLRIISQNYNYMYAVWCTGEHELYDLKKDPYGLKNLYDNMSVQLVNRLDALLVVLKSCRADTCRDPWKILHPGDRYVKTLQDALHEKYDNYYAQFRKVEFEQCLGFHLSSNEFPQIGHHFKSNVTLTQHAQHLKRQRQNATFKQEALQAVNSQKTIEKRNNPSKAIMIPQEYHDIFKLIPSSSQETIGQKIPDEDFEKGAIPVPTDLLETKINWSNYNFYSFGN
ncbi:MAG: alkaline-phosphatase-like protein [Benjaminiella poitrasii]|nr:MAG: alkaline-phosphatase-like protein [Benjaminiella poitrasii]